MKNDIRTWYEEGLLSRDPPDEVLSKIANGIDDCVNYGTRALARVLDSKEAPYTTDTPRLIVSTLFRHVIDMTDGISHLSRVGHGDGCIMLLRSLLEAYWYIGYILEKDTVQRSRSLYYKKLVHNSKWMKRSQQNSDANTEFVNNLKKSSIEFDASRLFGAYDSSKLDEVLKLMESNAYSDIAIEYKAAKKRNGREPQWYSLFGGPNNIRDLAYGLGDAWLYELVYTTTSNSIHPVDSVEDLSNCPLSGPAIRRLRFPGGIDRRASMACILLITISRRVVEHIAPSFAHDLACIYVASYQKYVDVVLNTKLEVIEIQDSK